jgi:hypothetical protein
MDKEVRDSFGGAPLSIRLRLWYDRLRGRTEHPWLAVFYDEATSDEETAEDELSR